MATEKQKRYAESIKSLVYHALIYVISVGTNPRGVERTKKVLEYLQQHGEKKSPEWWIDTFASHARRYRENLKDMRRFPNATPNPLRELAYSVVLTIEPRIAIREAIEARDPEALKSAVYGQCLFDVHRVKKYILRAASEGWEGIHLTEQEASRLLKALDSPDKQI